MLTGLDTRNKIVKVAGLPRDGKVTLVIGAFDPMYAAHVRRLSELCQPGTRLVIAVDAGKQALLPLQARAELLASLGCVDMVVTDTEGARAALPGATVVDERAADAERRQQLIALVTERHRAE